jgi:hypothetical protein
MSIWRQLFNPVLGEYIRAVDESVFEMGRGETMVGATIP